MQSCSTQGFLVKRDLAKQTLSYHQHTPLGSHNHRVLPGMGQNDYTACNQPCKTCKESNIEPQNLNTLLFRLPTNQTLTKDRHLVEGLKNDKSITVASNASNASNYFGITTIKKTNGKSNDVQLQPLRPQFNLLEQTMYYSSRKTSFFQQFGSMPVLEEAMTS